MEWWIQLLFSGAGVAVVSGLFAWFWHRRNARRQLTGTFQGGRSKNLYHRIKRGFKTSSQMGESFMLERQSDYGKWKELYTLPNPDEPKLLHVRWDTFGKGIEILKEQIKNHGFYLKVDACIGVNEAGLAMATFLAGSTDMLGGRNKIGYIRRGKKDRPDISPDSFFPNWGRTRQSCSPILS